MKGLSKVMIKLNLRVAKKSIGLLNVLTAAITVKLIKIGTTEMPTKENIDLTMMIVALMMRLMYHH